MPWRQITIRLASIGAIVIGSSVGTIGPTAAHPFGGGNHGAAAVPSFAGVDIENSIGQRGFVPVPANASTPTAPCGAQVVIQPGCHQINAAGANVRGMQVESATNPNHFVATGVYAGCVATLCTGIGPDGEAVWKHYVDGNCFSAYFFHRHSTVAENTHSLQEISREPSSSSFKVVRDGTLRRTISCSAFQGATTAIVESATAGQYQLDMSAVVFFGLARRDDSGAWVNWFDTGVSALGAIRYEHRPNCGFNILPGTFLGTALEGYGRC